MTNNSWLQRFSDTQQQPTGVTADAAPDEHTDAQFRALIEGPFKQAFDSRVQSIVRERLKNCKQSEQILRTLTPALEKLADEAGVAHETLDDRTAEALAQSILRQERSDEEDPAREAAMREGFRTLREQFAQVQECYPQADFSSALAEPAFMRLVARGVDAKSAYELTHLQELQRGAMAYGARRTREELAAAAQQGFFRPREGAMDPGAGAVYETDPARWSKQTRSEVKARARRGEKIRL